MFFRVAVASPLLALWLPATAWAATDVLTIGDEAPAMEVAHWLKGEPVTSFEPGRIYVLDFWATWCSPCRVEIPHTSKMQQKYDDYGVTFLAISDERLQTVVKFLCKADSEDVLWNDKIGYTLTTDPDRSTHKAYMTAAAQDGIPTTFVIGKDGRIEWIGDPTEMEGVLEQVLRDAWDRASFAVEYEKAVAPARQAVRLSDKMTEAADRGDWTQAVAAAEELLEAQPDFVRIKTRLFRKMLHQSDDPAVTFGYGRRVMREHWDDEKTLNTLAWFTVDDRNVPFRDFDFALEAALRANEVTDGKSASILDTVARVHFERGDVDEAVIWQKRALEQAGDSPMAVDIRETLIRYEKVAESRM